MGHPSCCAVLHLCALCLSSPSHGGAVVAHNLRVEVVEGVVLGRNFVGSSHTTLRFRHLGTQRAQQHDEAFGFHGGTGTNATSAHRKKC